jgi:hypothetical protein
MNMTREGLADTAHGSAETSDGMEYTSRKEEEEKKLSRANLGRTWKYLYLAVGSAVW